MSDIIDACVEDSMATKDSMALNHYVRRTDLEEDKDYRWRHGFAPRRRAYSLFESKAQYAAIPHSWLANGYVLRMEGNGETTSAIDLFQEVWSRGQPVVFTQVRVQ